MSNKNVIHFTSCFFKKKKSSFAKNIPFHFQALNREGGYGEPRDMHGPIMSEPYHEPYVVRHPLDYGMARTYSGGYIGPGASNVSAVSEFFLTIVVQLSYSFSISFFICSFMFFFFPSSTSTSCSSFYSCASCFFLFLLLLPLLLRLYLYISF